MTTIGERIKGLRDERGMSLFDLSIAARIPEQNIRRWEKGSTISDPAHVADLAKALNTTTDFLITGKSPKLKAAS